MTLLATALTLLCAFGSVEGYRSKHKRAATRRSVNASGSYEIFKFDDAIEPKAFVVSLFDPEMEVWHKHVNFTHNITVPGLSPLFPQVYCTNNYDLCNIVTGESEINAAASITALLASPEFNLTQTYFLIAGIAGVNPYYGSLGSVAFSRYSVSVALQYEVDAREMPKNWTTGYWTYGTLSPEMSPGNWYGTEVLELNVKLRDRAAALASKVNLSDASAAKKTRSLFNYGPANLPPSIIKCDSATSDVYFTGAILGEAFGNITNVFTNGTGKYCMTAQEDTAVLEAAIRGAKYGLTDYSRWVLMRTASDFDRPPPKFDAVKYFNYNNTGGFEISIDNIYKAGWPFINDVITHWNSTYKTGTYENGTYAPKNYIGDVFGTLGGTPNFGPGSYKNYTYV